MASSDLAGHGRVIGLVGLIGLAIFLGGSVLVALDLRGQMRRDATQELRSTAYLLADHASRLFEVADVALRGATAAIEGQDWDSIQHSEDLARQLRTTRSALPYVEDVWLNDQSGRLRLTSFAFPAPTSNAADRDVFKAQLQPTDKLYVGERIVGRVTGRPTFLLARRLDNPDSSLRGMVSVTADLAYFDDYWRRVRLPYDARVTLLRSGTLDVLAHFPGVESGAGQLAPSLVALRSAVEVDPSGGDLGYASLRQGELRTAAYRKVGSLPLYLMVSVSEDAIAAAWRTKMWNYGLFDGGGVLAFGALSLFGFRQARRDADVAAALDRARRDLEVANAGLESTVATRTAELRASEGRLRLILESATDYAIVTTDLNGTITQWTLGAREILGWESDEAVGHHIRMIFTDEDRNAGAVEAEQARALCAGRAAADRWHLRKDGTRFYALGAMLPMREAGDGAPIGFLLILRDRTQEFEVERARSTLNETLERLVAERTAALEAANAQLVAEASSRELAEAKLRQAQKMEAVGRITGGVAHDFNNLLTIVMGNLDMLRQRLGASDPRVTRLVDRAIQGADRAAGLTRQLLAFSRQQPLSPEAVDANRLVAGMSDMLRRTLGESIVVERRLSQQLWRTQADPNQLESAVLNLAVNARDAMPEGGTLTLETANLHLEETSARLREDVQPGDYVSIAVSDTGCGMTPEVAAKVFEPFFTTKPIGKGTGLGLSQVYGFVKQSRGHATIQSEPGKGTTIGLYLPRFAEVDDLNTEPHGRPVQVRLDASISSSLGRTVLVVEDEALVREFSVLALDQAGFRVLGAEDADDALALLDTHPDIALLFTDIVLTGPMNGRKLADEALRRRPDLKVLFTTGYSRDAIIHHGRLDEGVELLSKPFTAAELTGRVLDLLGRRVADDAPPNGKAERLDVEPETRREPTHA